MAKIDLWSPDTFFSTENVFHTSDNMSVGTVAREFYNLKPSRIQQSGGFEVNSKNFLIDGVILKRLDGNMNVLSTQIAIYRYLHSNGINTPEILINTNGAYITKYENEMWLAMEYIDGSFYSCSQEELELLITTLPTLFEALRCCNIEGISCLPHRPLIETPYIQYEYNSYEEYGEELQEMITWSLPDISRISRQVLSYLPSISDTLSLVHIDLHPKNILYKNNRLYILDLDSLLLQPSSIAYNFSIYKLLRRCIARHIPFRPFVATLFQNTSIERNPLAAQAEILLRLVSTLQRNATGNLSVWKELMPVHLRGLYESEIILGEAS